MSHRILGIGLIALIALVVLAAVGWQAPVQGQTLPEEPVQLPPTRGRTGDLLGDPVFEKVYLLGELGRFGEAIAECRRIALEHPGTELEATARCRMARYMRSDRVGMQDQSRAEFEAIARRFPGSKYWLDAALRLADTEAEESAVLVQVGGVPLEAVRSGQVRHIREDRIPVQYRDYVFETYYGNGLISEDTTEMLRFLQFARASFPETDGSDITGTLMEKFLTMDQLNNQRFDDTPPVVQIGSPSPDAPVSPGGAGLDLTAYGGDLLASQVDLANSKVYLDGQAVPVTSWEVDSQIDPHGPIFELLRIRYQPPQPLTPGPHAYRVVVVDTWEQVTERTVSFTVVQPPPVDITATVLSKHVKPRKNESLVVDVASNRTPVHYTFSIYRQ
ncbi:MAG: hypothetical protein AB1758_34785, partial [Candidatus Eremiobacterota bacterium]